LGTIGGHWPGRSGGGRRRRVGGDPGALDLGGVNHQIVADRWHKGRRDLDRDVVNHLRTHAADQDRPAASLSHAELVGSRDRVRLKGLEDLSRNG
jgi:hypothetical protein